MACLSVAVKCHKDVDWSEHVGCDKHVNCHTAHKRLRL